MADERAFCIERKATVSFSPALITVRWGKIYRNRPVPMVIARETITDRVLISNGMKGVVLTRNNSVRATPK